MAVAFDGNLPARQYGSLGFDYSSIGSINSQMSIAPDYLERLSPTQTETQHEYERFQGINVGSRRLKDRLMNVGKDYNSRNRPSISKVMDNTFAVFKDQNISSLGQHGLGMQAHGKLDLMLGKDGYK